MRKAILGMVGLLAFGALHAEGSGAQLLRPTSGLPPSFEVATIKPNNGAFRLRQMRFSPANFSAQRYSLKDLIKWAYRIKSDDQLLGGRPWMSTEFYDVIAKAAENEVEAIDRLDREQAIERTQLMLQSLLADRFQLKTSIQKRELPIFALVVAKGGPKLKKVQTPPIASPGTQLPPGSRPPGIGTTGESRITATSCTMDMMSEWLSQVDEVGARIVLNETGLQGSYDFVLSGVSVASALPPGVTLKGQASENKMSILTALQEQLGLKLEPRKARVEVLVIESAERPSPN